MRMVSLLKRAKEHHHLGSALLRQGKPEEAAASFRRAMELVPAFAPAHGGLGDAWHAQGKLAEAVAAYRQAVALDAGMVEAWWGLGCAESALREHALAAESFRHVVEPAPDYGEARHNLGKELFDLGQVDTALETFREAVPRLEARELPLGMIATVIPGSPRADHQAVLEARRAWVALRPVRTLQDFCASRRPPPTTVSASAMSRRFSKTVTG